MVEDANEDYLYYGTPIEREEELSAGHKRKIALDAGQMRRLPPWKQEVTDEEGRRRFHGAFTGGFSAGFYNTVGSKEGWAPRTFMSSRKNRSEVKGQTVYSFLDDDEKAEFEARELSSSSQFDTFGFTAAEVARKQAEKELQTRPSAIPGPVPDEIIVPVAESIGVKLLVKMGWRHGRSIGASDNASISESRREARKAFLAFSQNKVPSLSPNMVLERQPPMKVEVIGVDKTNELERDVDAAVQVPRSTPVFVIHPKSNLYGLGYDPFKNAPEFRERYMHMSQEKETGLKKIGRLHGSLFRPNAGKTATGFGIGALEDIEEEDEDIYSSGGGMLVAPEEEVEKPSHRLERRKERTVKSHDGVLPGFKLASVSTCRKEWFIPSTIPLSFVPQHKFSVPLEVERNFFQLAPPEVAPPHDSELCMMIEGLATFVARSGKIFEDLSREKNANNPLFCFLFGGTGHDYYRRKLWEEQKRLAEQGKDPIEKSSERKGQKLNSEDRGRVLGERPLEKSLDSGRKCVPSDVDRLQSILFDTFTKPASLLDGAAAVQPFHGDPAKQARFEQFLKDKYQGGLRSCYVGDDSRTEIERAQERLDFEAAVEIIEKGSQSQKNSASVNENLDLVSAVGTRFTSGGIETMDSMHLQQRGPENGGQTETKQFPQREEHQWRPSLLLCKRFNLLDPYAGKPPPLPKARSKMESLILISNSNPVRDLPETSSIIEGRYNIAANSVSQSQLEAFNPNEVDEDKEEVVEAKDAVVKKPVDLYKAIFSDESDNDEEENTEKQLDSHEKSAQGANATLNRLIAGDFLESLGKELGLKVPRDLDLTEKGKDVPLVSKESRRIGEGETTAVNDISMLAKSSFQKAVEWNPNPKSRMYGSVSSLIKNEEKEADAYEIGETHVAKDSGFKEENTIWHESGKSDYLGNSSTQDALNNSSSDYDRGKENIMERKRKRDSTRERRKSHSKRHHKKEHRSRDDYMRKKRDKDKESCDHKKRKNRKRRRRDSSVASSSSEPSHES